MLKNIDLRGTGYCASLNFRRAARAITKLFDQAFESDEVRSTQFTILVSVAKTQPTSIGALADLLVLDRTTLTRSLRLLEKDGLLTVSARTAMRKRFVSLTLKGEHTLARTVPQWRKVQGRFVNAVGDGYWRELRSELERLAGVALSLERGGNGATAATVYARPA